MGSLSSELRPLAAELARVPRVYVDANMPAGAVTYMRQALHWDVLFVLEDPDLRRATDRDHFRRALEFGRTLISLDHDFFDQQKFPSILSPGVVICTAPDEPGLKRLLKHLDRSMLAGDPAPELPLRGQVIELTMNSLTAEELRTGSDPVPQQP